ncbi:hypothetical protein GCM10027168_63240 [Streptomyces capparidis]
MPGLGDPVSDLEHRRDRDHLTGQRLPVASVRCLVHPARLDPPALLPHAGASTRKSRRNPSKPAANARREIKQALSSAESIGTPGLSGPALTWPVGRRLGANRACELRALA